MLTVAGDWLAQVDGVEAFKASAGQGVTTAKPLQVDSSALGRWDSGLIAFLWDAKRIEARAGRTLDPSGLPEAASKLLGLLPDAAPIPAPAVRRRFQPISRLGGAALAALNEIGAVGTQFAAVITGIILALRGRARMRTVDLLSNISDAGPSALLIVGVVNFLIGAILAFVGAVQLRKFAADMYVANLVGLALVREMAAVMTAIVMAGRTGGAYAARIATMQGNEELDALVVVGVPVSDYIVLPAVLALVFTMPFLYLYGCLIGMVGGFVVAMGMLTVTGPGYLSQTIDAVGLDQFMFGFTKSILFALLIGVTSCRIGLRAGRSAADVGFAATRAVVVGIVGIIAMDAVFAVIADVLNF